MGICQFKNISGGRDGMERQEGDGRDGKGEATDGQEVMTEEGKTSVCTPWGLWCRQSVREEKIGGVQLHCSWGMNATGYC